MTYRAFTLIELITSVGIIVMMLALSLPAYLEFQRQQNFKTAANTLRDAVIETQTYALAPRGDEADVPGKIPGADYYRIVFYNDGTGAHYRIEEQTNTVLNDFLNITWKPVKSGTLPYGVTYCATNGSLHTGAAVTTNSGLIYSISQQGRIVSPALPGTQFIRLQSRALANRTDVQIRTETGQISLVEAGLSC